MIKERIDIRPGSVLVSIEDTRVKLGTDGYCALVHKNGIIAEGNFACDDAGTVSFTWRNVLRYEDDGGWKAADPIATAGNGDIVSSFSWTDEKVVRVKPDETSPSFWGEEKEDVRESLVKNNFQMKKVFLDRAPQRNRGARRDRGGIKNTNSETEGDGKKNDAADASKKEESTIAAADASTKEESTDSVADASTKDGSTNAAVDASTKEESTNAAADASTKEESTNAAVDAPTKEESTNAAVDAPTKDESTNAAAAPTKEKSTNAAVDASTKEESTNAAAAPEEDSSK